MPSRDQKRVLTARKLRQTLIARRMERGRQLLVKRAGGVAQAPVYGAGGSGASGRLIADSSATARRKRSSGPAAAGWRGGSVQGSARILIREDKPRHR